MHEIIESRLEYECGPALALIEQVRRIRRDSKRALGASNKKVIADQGVNGQSLVQTDIEKMQPRRRAETDPLATPAVTLDPEFWGALRLQYQAQ